MGLSLEDFAAASKPRRQLCTVQVVLDQLDSKDRDVLVSVLADDSIKHAAIERVLAANGHRLTQSTIGRHRKGECACGR